MANLILLLAGGIVLLALGISFYRLLAGPDFMNRAVAFDTMTIMSLSVIGLLSHFLGRITYLDVALVYGLLSFLGVLVIARYGDREL